MGSADCQPIFAPSFSVSCLVSRSNVHVQPNSIEFAWAYYRHLVCGLKIMYLAGLCIGLAQEYFSTSFFGTEHPATYVSCPYSILVNSGGGPE